MPLYEYSCHVCGTQFEKRVQFSESDKVQECPTCHSQNTNKLISTFASRGSGDGGSANSFAAPRSSSPFT